MLFAADDRLSAAFFAGDNRLTADTSITLLSNISKIAWPIKAKLYVALPLEEGKKVYINGAGHMTKMAAMLIYGKNFQKSSPSEIIVV